MQTYTEETLTVCGEIQWGLQIGSSDEMACRRNKRDWC